MPSDSFRSRHITVSGLDRWQTALARMGQPGRDARDEWQRATEVFYNRTQEHTHIITGRLIASGRYEVEQHGDTLEGIVTYGGTEEVHYAAAEFARGGSHDALLIGFLEAQRHFVRALLRIMEREATGWR
jgi:hypothetical protein